MKKAKSATAPIPRPEYPRPQFRRAAWMNLNGVWDFASDPGRSGLDRDLPAHPERLGAKILVPFCPESPLSGIGNRDFVESVFYHRTVVFPRSWASRRIFLHFGGVDYHARVWLDGEVVGEHRGGSAPFSLDATRFARPGKRQSLVVHALDFTRSWEQGLGKQSLAHDSSGCCYTRTTGIWQTVWAEAVHPQGLESCAVTPNLDAAQVVFAPRFHSAGSGASLRISIRRGGRAVAERTVPAAQGAPVAFDIPDVRAWSPSDPFLYDAELTVERGGRVLDRVRTYFAMRKVSVEGRRILLNGEPVFLRFVLDQGFYPQGVWTAPSDAELKADIRRSMAAGFNGARLHQKVFEDRFHYWADRLGYLTWAEYPSYRFGALRPIAQRNFTEEWSAVVRALRNHPSIIGWSPLNETTGNEIGDAAAPWEKEGNPMIREYRLFVQGVSALTRALDPTRPVNDASGWIHADTDLWTVHSYCADPDELEKWLLPKDAPVAASFPRFEVSRYAGQPYLLDEWGGIKYRPPEDCGDDGAWGYTQAGAPEEYLGRLRALAGRLLSLPGLAGWCFTQLTDVEQEQNGLYTYDRRPKIPMARFREIFGAKPAWSAW